MSKRKIFVDWQPMLTNKSGVGHYIYNLTEGIVKLDSQSLYDLVAFSFSQKHFAFDLKGNTKTTIIRSIPRSIYLKLIEHRIYIPIECFCGFHDVYVCGNFVMFPNIRGKVITVIHDLTYLKYPEFMEEKNLAHLSRLVPYAITHSDHLIAASETIKKEIIEQYHVDETKVSVLYPMVKFNEIGEKKPKGLGDGTYMLYISNLEPRKNLLRMIEAYAKLPDDLRKQYQFVIAGGKGWKCDEILAAIEKYHLTYLGYISEEEKAYLYHHASLFVYASVYEGFGMPIIEAMHAHVPVLTSTTSCMPEIAGKGAIYVNPLDVEDIANRMEEILLDTTMQHTLQQEADIQVAYFKSQNQPQQLLDIINKL